MADQRSNTIVDPSIQPSTNKPKQTRKGKLYHLTPEERKEHRRNQNRLDKQKSRLKEGPKRRYTLREDLSHLTEEELRLRQNRQKNESRNRIKEEKKQQDTMSINGDDVEEYNAEGDDDLTDDEEATTSTKLYLSALKEDDEADEQKFMAFLREDRDYTSQKIADNKKSADEAIKNAADNRAAQYKSFLNERKQARTELIQRHFSTNGKTKPGANTEVKRRRASLKHAQQVPLADRLAVDTMMSPTEANSPMEETSPTETKGSRTEATSPTQMTDNTEATSPAEATSPHNQRQPLILKSAMRTSIPKRKSVLLPIFSMFGSGKNKNRLSFQGEATRTVYTPPNSDEKHKMYGHPGGGDEPEIEVVVFDKPAYDSWRHLHDGAFIVSFSRLDAELAEDHSFALQVLHAARVMNILKELDPTKLRALALKIFPRFRTRFPRLIGKDGKDQRGAFLVYLNYRLDCHIEETRELEKASGPKWVQKDRVTMEEKNRKQYEIDYLPDSPVEV